MIKYTSRTSHTKPSKDRSVGPCWASWHHSCNSVSKGRRKLKADPKKTNYSQGQHPVNGLS